MNDFSRLFEHAFPLRQASIDSVHEKSVRHGHISTLHIWPAHRALAASRAAMLATLLPDLGSGRYPKPSQPWVVYLSIAAGVRRGSHLEAPALSSQITRTRLSVVGSAFSNNMLPLAAGSRRRTISSPSATI